MNSTHDVEHTLRDHPAMLYLVLIAWTLGWRQLLFGLLVAAACVISSAAFTPLTPVIIAAGGVLIFWITAIAVTIAMAMLTLGGPIVAILASISSTTRRSK